jgi:hypothetical protein
MPGQFSNFQGGRLVSMDAQASNYNLLMERGVIYRLTNITNKAGRQGPIFYFPQWFGKLSVNCFLEVASASGSGELGFDFVMAQNAGDSIPFSLALGEQQGPPNLTSAGSFASQDTSGWTAGFFELQLAGSYVFPLTARVYLDHESK